MNSDYFEEDESKQHKKVNSNTKKYQKKKNEVNEQEKEPDLVVESQEYI